MNSVQTWQPTEPFRPRRWLAGGHRQTIAGHLLQRTIALPDPEERLVEVAPGVQVLCHCHWQPDRQAALTVIGIHGLEGSSDSGYMRGVAKRALAAGMNMIRMNQRNCGGTDHIAPTLYHSGLSSDVMRVAEHLIAAEGIPRIALVGYSMGGNLVLKTAGEWGSARPELKAVAAVCPSADLAASADALHEPANRLYEIYFVRRLKTRLAEKARLFPNDFRASAADGVSTVREFDDKVTGPLSGFRDADDYYARAAAANVVDQIAVPTLVLHAADDPFIRLLPQTRAKLAANPHIRFLETEHGGHCSFLASPHDGFDGHWAEKQVVEFLLAATV